MPPTPSATVEDSPAPTSEADEQLRAGLRRLLAGAEGWTVADRDPMILETCDGVDWSAGATGGSGGDFDVSGDGRGPSVWSDQAGFPSEAAAARAIDRIVEGLRACTTSRWTVGPVAETGAVLATSAAGAVWVQRRGEVIATLQVPTSDGPPPLMLETSVADLLAEFLG